MMPIRAIMRIGRTDRDVMPLIASATIFASVYFVSPCNRGNRSYATVAVVNPELYREPAQEYVRFAVKRKRAQRPVAHQAEIGMVRNDIGAEPIENAIVEVRRAALKAAVSSAPLRTAKTISAPPLKLSIIFKTTDMSSCRSASREITASAFPICGSKPANSAF